MKLRTLTAATALLILACGCELTTIPPTNLVEWKTQDGKPLAVIETQPGMQIAYLVGPDGQSMVKRITIPIDSTDDDNSIELTEIPFAIKLLGQEPYGFSCPNCVPCLAGDDCVPPVPPQIFEFPQLELP
ncbi:MAG: hypothetical protein AB8G17_11440 [Gammaproteobacteria bacterium]